MDYVLACVFVCMSALVQDNSKTHPYSTYKLLDLQIKQNDSTGPGKRVFALLNPPPPFKGAAPRSPNFFTLSNLQSPKFGKMILILQVGLSHSQSKKKG